MPLLFGVWLGLSVPVALLVGAALAGASETMLREDEPLPAALPVHPLPMA
jgi:hypothetical protein